MSTKDRRNAVTYFMQLIGTTAALLIMTVRLPRFITVTDLDKSFDKTDVSLISVIVSLVYYLYEIIYKTSINLPLMVHHLLTIVMGILICFMLWDTFNPAAAYPIVMLYSAVTEQPVFIALLLYRFKYPSYRWFVFASIASVVSKTAVFCIVWVVVKKALLDVEYENLNNDFQWKRFMVYALSVANVSLFVVQVYSVRTYWILGNKSKKYFDKQVGGEVQQVRALNHNIVSAGVVVVEEEEKV